MDIICRRLTDNKTEVNIKRKRSYPGSTEFNWGIKGSTGANDLALHILFLFVDDSIAWKFHLEFKRDFITPLPDNGGTIKERYIREWLKKYV